MQKIFFGACNKIVSVSYNEQKKTKERFKMTIEERFGSADFSQLSRVKDSLLLNLKLRRRAINEEMSLEELDYVAAAGKTFGPKKLDDNKR